MLVLTILKIIGILLLALLGLLFSSALLVLVVPLRYRIWMEYQESLKAKVFARRITGIWRKLLLRTARAV